jgi:hypothetical protein
MDPQRRVDDADRGHKKSIRPDPSPRRQRGSTTLRRPARDGDHRPYRRAYPHDAYRPARKRRLVARKRPLVARRGKGGDERSSTSRVCSPMSGWELLSGLTSISTSTSINDTPSIADMVSAVPIPAPPHDPYGPARVRDAGDRLHPPLRR